MAHRIAGFYCDGADKGSIEGGALVMAAESQEVHIGVVRIRRRAMGGGNGGESRSSRSKA